MAEDELANADRAGDIVVDLTGHTVAGLGAPVHAQIMAHLRDAVMLVDADGVVSYASPTTERVLGTPASEWVGRHLVAGFAEPDVGAVTRALSRSVDAPPDPGSRLLGGDPGALTLFVDTPLRLGPPGTRLLTFRPVGDHVEVAPVPSRVAVDGDFTFDLSEAEAMIEALDEGRMQVHYQPEIDLETGMVLGAEALLRWDHDERGLVTAGEFVTIAEQVGVLPELGRFVIRLACQEFGSWARRFGGTVLTLRVNLSAVQLGEVGVVDIVRDSLADAGLDADCLCVEVTETTLMSDPGALRALERLRDLGVKVAVDDFGTGYSSLSQLKQLPVDVLKIDRSFVAGLGLSPDDTAIIRAIVELARAVGLGVVAEGIEHPRQVDELLRLGCRRGQGWLYAKALPWATLESEFLGA